MQSSAVKAVSSVLKKVPEWLSRTLKAWFRFFWRLGVVGKIVATAAETILLVIVAAGLSLGAMARREVM